MICKPLVIILNVCGLSVMPTYEIFLRGRGVWDRGSNEWIFLLWNDPLLKEMIFIEGNVTNFIRAYRLWFIVSSPSSGPPGANEKPLPGSHFSRSPFSNLVWSLQNCSVNNCSCSLPSKRFLKSGFKCKVLVNWKWKFSYYNFWISNNAFFLCLLTFKLILEYEPGTLNHVQRVIHNIN